MWYFIAYVALVVANFVLQWNLPWWVFLLAAAPFFFVFLVLAVVFILGAVGLLEEKPKPTRWRA